ncbi:6-carboxyhexanoate--CoA ligase [Sporomusa termitida]|uniref:6-carboxyhexanoate--CoA ligase n=1 Tax=Sporomusa termitida TaxID=2377 RepID=A0A517DRL9_9FIRM|nr:6-carboxyhexanoate--CoA ligase [Sporomusa termitida]QDR79958.1 6-carboxyhexanoate--CoA ligase [Sporomusa termitida]
MLYSVRMRAAQGGPHERGGKHIAGAERLVERELLTATAAAMLERALSHSRGTADFTNLIVEAVPAGDIRTVSCLPVISVAAADVKAGRALALAALIKAGVTPAAAAAGLQVLQDTNNRRGAIIAAACTGVRLDTSGERGIRVSRMDSADQPAYWRWLERQGYTNVHIREALILATKVMAAPGIVAELCWSDDPEYMAGYVATPAGYTRFTRLKPYGSDSGGRILFVKKNTDMAELINYLRFQPVFIRVPEEEGANAIPG